jgi:hypothetical protein
MYTSFYSKNSHSPKNKGRAKSRTSISETISLSGLDASIRPILELNARFFNNRISVNFIFDGLI